MRFLILATALFLLISSTLSHQLRFNKDGKFKIVQFTDLHFGEDNQEMENTYKLMLKILDAEQPDLVAVTGDVVSGYAWDEKTRPWYANHYHKFTQALRERNIHWALTAGNHDREGDLTDEEVLELDLTYAPLSLTKRNPEALSHPFNYWLPVFSKNSEEIMARLFFIDTGRENCLHVPGYDCIRPDQIEWFLKESASF